jgi:hypothetical protein
VATALKYEADAGDPAAPITLLWVRPNHVPSPDGFRELDDALSAIVARYAPMVELRVVSEVPPDLVRGPGNSPSLAAPTLLVLRRGQVVGEAMGTKLPARELDRVVRCAVEWPSEIR